MAKKHFVSIIWGYHRQIFSFPREQHYHLLPLLAMLNAGYECTVCALSPEVRIEDDPQWDSRISVFYPKNAFEYLRFLWSNRDAVLYANSLTLRTLAVGLIGKRTVFCPQSCPLPQSFFRGAIAIFFYRFFTKVRVMNNGEVFALRDRGVKNAIALPLSVAIFDPKIPQPDGKTLLILGNLTPIKNPFFLLEAFAIAKKTIPNLRLRVIGEDRMERLAGVSFAQKVADLGLGNAVEILGFVPSEKIAEKTHEASAYLNASTSEGMCLAAYEAAMLGVLPILPDILAFESVFRGRVPLYRSGDAADLAVAIVSTLSDEKMVADRVQKAQDFIADRFSYERIFAETKNLFLSISK